MSRKKQPPGRLPPWGVGVQSTLVVGAIGACGDYFSWSPLLGFGAAAIGGLCSVLRAAGDEQGAHPDRVVIHLGRWTGLGGWLAWVWTGPEDWFARFAAGLGVGDITGDPLSLAGLGTLAAGAQVSAHLDLYMRRRPRTPDSEGGLVLRSQARLEAEWQARIARVCRIQVEITSLRHWDSGAGYTLTVLFPPGGATRHTLAVHADALASDARLDEGCGVEVLKGPHRGSAVLQVSTVDRMSEELDYPSDYSPRSILDQAALGEYRNGEIAGPHLRENAGLVVGTRGSGKTTLLRVLTAAVGRCTDALVWHIDLTGGGLSRDWLRPWLDGNTERPAIDWAVNTVEDALAMARAAVAISKDRKESGHERKVAANTTLLPIDEDMPEIVIIIDEGKTILAPSIRDRLLRDLRETLNLALDIARDSAVNVVFSALGATSTSLDTAIKAQCSFKLGMLCEKDAELAYLFDWGQATMDDLAGVGSGFIRESGAAPRPMGGYNLTPRRIIDELAPAVSQRQPALDERAARAAGSAYADRYVRMREAFGKKPATPEPSQSAPSSPAPVGDTLGWSDPADIARDSGGTAVLERPALAPAEARGRVVAPVLVDALQVFDAEDTDRLPRELLAARVTDGDEDELRRRMVAAGAGPPHSIRYRGNPARGWYRRDIEEAMAVTPA